MCLKLFLSIALAALLFNGAEPLNNANYAEHIKFGPVVQGVMSFKEKCYGRRKIVDEAGCTTDAKRRPIMIPSAF